MNPETTRATRTALPARRIARVLTTPPLGPGFAGPAHVNAAIIEPGIDGFAATDPFFLMNDDHVVAGGPLGEMHPHAGLETVSFLVSGELSADGFTLGAGDVEWMTAGRGVMHSEHSDTPEGFRLLQLWIALPDAAYDMPPRLQLLRRDDMPVVKAPGATARVYSGASHGTVSPAKNVVPVTIVDIALEPGARFTQEVPLPYNGFVLVLEGSVNAGATDDSAGENLKAGQSGWLDRPEGEGDSAITLSAGTQGARAILYAAEPLRERIAWYGPFLAGSQAGLRAHFDDYRRGAFPRAAQLAHEDTATRVAAPVASSAARRA